MISMFMKRTTTISKLR